MLSALKPESSTCCLCSQRQLSAFCTARCWKNYRSVARYPHIRLSDSSFLFRNRDIFPPLMTIRKIPCGLKLVSNPYLKMKSFFRVNPEKIPGDSLCGLQFDSQDQRHGIRSGVRIGRRILDHIGQPQMVAEFQ